MITRWLNLGGDWRSLTANDRPLREEGVSRRLLGSRQITRWWQNELALTATPCFRLTTGAAGGGGNAKTFFTLFSVVDRMHRPQ
jgi:hypothetical protein